MTKLTHNLGAKIIACFLVIIAGFSAASSGAGIYYAYKNGFFSNNAKPYHETSICHHITYQYAQELIEALNHDQWNYGEKEAFAPKNTNFRYVIATEFGDVLLTNRTKDETTALVEKRPFVLRTDTGVLENGTEWHSDATTTTEDGADAVNVILESYITNPPTVSDHYWNSFWIHQSLYDIHGILLPVLGVSLLVFALCFVFLLCAAGHQAGKEEIVLNLQDKIPLDLYLFLVFPAVSTIGYYFLNGNLSSYIESIIVNIIGLLALSILSLATILTCATRIKLGRYFYQNTICYKILQLFGKLFAWFWDALKSIPAMWKVAVAWLIISCVYIGGGFGAIILNLVLTFVFCTIAAQMEALKDGGEELAKGNLKNKIDTKRMYPPFRTHGEHLNSVSKGFSIALNQKMKSERLKTELITNVSHDIKTPLTSIINYVDLLKKEELTGQAAEYIEVLDRQSRRLKKLTEDLVEASKASTGNIKVSLVPTDMVELISQAAAEYEEKLALAKLEVIVNAAETPIYAMVDGNLTWRVLSNLLSNACKYSQTDTRVYIDIQKEADLVTVSMKNISKDALNIPVEELMERFVRGDSSRHTEGSGLGLNIAQSLVNLQKGKFTLDIEGDLFKAYIKFPAAEPPAPP
ncbi:MAG: HAMP domain-containing histidine kinase, partial [Anaerotignum sp.]|nr:HAMP domain-containing histidine kinase [Anaerotignum sp.]